MQDMAPSDQKHVGAFLEHQLDRVSYGMHKREEARKVKEAEEKKEETHRLFKEKQREVSAWVVVDAGLTEG